MCSVVRRQNPLAGYAGRSRPYPALLAQIIGVVAASTTLPSAAYAQAAPNTLVSVCSGVSLPRSVVTGIIDPVVTGIYGPTESNINTTLAALGGLPGLPAPLSIDVNGLLTSAAAGDNVGLSVIAQDGTLLGPADECNAQADSYTLDNPAGISIGGNAITGLGANGEEAQAGEIDSIAIGNRAATDATAVGSIAFGTDASVGAGAVGSAALGTGSLVTVANSIALGAGTVAARGPLTGYVAFGLAGTQQSAGEVSVGSPGQERQITNVAPGSAPTDAVNLAQLQAVADLIPDHAVLYDDASHATITLDGASGTLITNVAAGAVTATSTDAINGSQLFALDQQVQSNTMAITNIQTSINNGSTGPVRYSNPGTPTTPNGGTPTNDVTLVGGAPGPVGLHNVRDGTVAAGSTDAVNGGQLHLTNIAVAAAQETANQALELNQNAVTYDNSGRTSVTLGNAGTPVQVSNVAAGTAGTDAVNVHQLQGAVGTAIDSAMSYIDARINELDFDLRNVRREGRAGSAAALAAAGMPQASDPGRSMIAAGVGTYRGRTALAIGASHRTENGQTVLKLGVTYDSSQHVGANAGVGFEF
jgi:autotransporter adhesin